MKKNLALIGMMGCGKTTIAKELSFLLPDLKCIDIDCEIEQTSGKKISEIFLKYGEHHFRILEQDQIKKIFEGNNQIISLGGGAFESSINRDIILKNSKVIYLKTSAEEIHERIKNEYHRPLLSKNNSTERIKELIILREPNYKKADYIIETDNKTPKEIAEEILGVI